MKVRLEYYIREEKIIDMIPEEYCEFRASHSPLFPDGSLQQSFEIVDEESKKELNDFFENLRNIKNSKRVKK